MEAILLRKSRNFAFPLTLAALAVLFSSPCIHAQIKASPPPDDTSASPPDVDTAALLNSMDALNDQRKLSVGDRVSYRVIEEQKDPISLTITDSGDLAVPLLGLYPAAGKTCKQLALQLKPLLERDYFYKATVIVGLDTESTRSLGKVYLTGQVHSQGTIDLPANQPLTVSEAIMENGGFADFANQRKVKLTHKDPQTGKVIITTVDVKDILTRGHAEKDPVLQPNDTISVPEKLINF